VPVCAHVDGSKNCTAEGYKCATTFLKADGMYKCWKEALARVGLHPRGYTNGLLRLIKDVVDDAKEKEKAEAKGKGPMSPVDNDEDDSEQGWESFEHLLVGSSRVGKTVESDLKASSSSSSSSSSSRLLASHPSHTNAQRG
jgi:hypothetical protein